MKIFLLTILTFLFLGLESDKPLKLKDLYGTWINDSLYFEMLVSKSPHQSGKFIYDAEWLELSDSSVLHWYSDAAPFTSASLSKNILTLKCNYCSFTNLNINVLNDSTMFYTDPDRGEKVILKKFNKYTSDFKKSNNENPFYYFIKKKYFQGEKKLFQVENQSQTTTLNFSSSCEVQNFLDYSKYSLFAGGSEDTPDMDILILDSTKGKSFYFNYKLSSDSIYVYQLKFKNSKDFKSPCDTLDSELTKGKLLYILTEKK